ncbi:MAG: UDP-N-acetylmuramoyl-L-alanyl-D-glutamate--2,6-diaminopimelate ligase, partial [Spirochaetales bacterium]|nr:UDP-N-acetylmuramoyl-L-alanyl-D-glutamate--2,6-diaminopimelate ligase [Spirochaetales bacterium]
ALKGIHTDGHEYIDKAIKNGAAVVFHSDDLPEFLPEVSYVKVEDTRYIMSPVSSAFYDHPSGKMKVIGVTGTNGKSTTVSMIYQLLGMADFKTGFISTVQFDTGRGPVKNHYRQSTPEATEIHKLLFEMVKNGCKYAVVEATSHGLSAINNRLGDVLFDGAVFTNITHEHLEFHKTLDRYIDDKANLFRSLDTKTGFGIINIDDPAFSRFQDATEADIFSYSKTDSKASISADNISGAGQEASFSLSYNNTEYNAHLNLPKIFNVENSMAAIIAVIKATNMDISTFLPFMDRLIPAEGRMIPVVMGQDFDVLVDYAHSPGSFELLFPALREMTKGRLISVFGSAGERDISKRSVQGSIADEYSDIIVLTDEDPRGETPMSIIKDIASGCSGRIENMDLFLIENRNEAIRFAFKIAQKNDFVVLLGKGHESTIIYKDGPIPWKEKDAAVTILKEMGYNNLNSREGQK